MIGGELVAARHRYRTAGLLVARTRAARTQAATTLGGALAAYQAAGHPGIASGPGKTLFAATDALRQADATLRAAEAAHSRAEADLGRLAAAMRPLG